MDSVATITSKDDGKTFEVPESCIGNARDARETVDTLVKAENTRSKNRAKFKGMLKGNKPWPGLLRGKGQGDRANFSQREAEGFIAAAKTPYYALAFKAERFVQLTLDYGEADPGLLAQWAGKIATRYQYALEDWDGLDMHMQLSQFTMVAYGSGPMVWQDERDWHSSSRLAGQFLLPDDASADMDEWDTGACPRSYLPTVLWKKIKNETAATARGWNVPACKRAIMLAGPEALRSSYGNTWEFYEAEMRKGATGWNAKSKRIFVADLFQKEFTGKISHFMLQHESEGNTDPKFPALDEDDPMCGFLFRKIGRFDSFGQIVCPFLYDVGDDGQWHSVKGAGPKIFDFCSVSDRLNCRMVDGAMAATGMAMKAKDVKALAQTAMTTVTGGVVIGPDYEVEQQRVFPDLQSPLLVKRDLKSTLSDNTGQYRQRVREENPEPTLGQAELNESKQSILGEGDASRYCKYLDRFHRETFRRMLAMGKKLYASRKKIAPVDFEKEKALTPSENGALKFYRGCVVTDGIPEDILEFENFCRIKATRLVGNGSATMRTMISKDLLTLLPMADERGKNFALRNAVSASAGELVADQMFPLYGSSVATDSETSMAALENNFLGQPNAELEVDPAQNHVVHFESHLQAVGRHAQRAQGGQDDPHNLLLRLEQTGPHTHEHLQNIQGDPTRKGQFEKMQKAWLAMSKMADQLKQQLDEADKAAAAQQPEQAPDPALLAALAKVHEEALVKREGMLLKHGLAEKNQQFKMRQKDITTAHGMRLKNLEVVQPETAAA